MIDVLKRSTLSVDDWRAWLDRFTAWKGSWEEGEFVPTIHAPWYNSKAFLRSLYFRLQTTPDLPPETAALKEHVLEAVKAFGQ